MLDKLKINSASQNALSVFGFALLFYLLSTATLGIHNWLTIIFSTAAVLSCFYGGFIVVLQGREELSKGLKLKGTLVMALGVAMIGFFVLAFLLPLIT